MDRRKHTRFKIKDLTLAKLWFKFEGDYVQGLDQLLDISRGGLSLCSFVRAEKIDAHSEMEIFLSGGDFNIEKIPFEIISDIEITGNSTSSKLALRRYGIRFDTLTPDQASRLDYFLANYTSGEA